VRLGFYALAVLWQLAICNAAYAGSVRVSDDVGRPVRLDAPAQRIVTLSPHTTELVFASGAGSRLVAVAAYSDHPAAARDLPVISGLHGLDRERLLALAPDLVVAWASGNSAADLAWLDGLDLAVYHSEPRALADIPTSIEKLGRLAGTSDAAQTAAQDLRHALADACPHAADAAPRPAFIRLAEQPLLTVGGGHWLDQAIGHAGLRNIYADLPAGSHAISRESLLARAPFVTLYLRYSGMSGTDGSGIGLDPALWARPGPRLFEGIAILCRQLAQQHRSDRIPSWQETGKPPAAISLPAPAMAAHTAASQDLKNSNRDLSDGEH
jgi:iron complex transport system substrate-binding protein